jgi:hypothetical protein
MSVQMTEVHSCSYYCDRPECIKAQRDELRDRLAQPEQEPVAWLYRDSWGTMKLSQVTPPPVGAFPVYTTPPQRKPLTWERVLEIGLKCANDHSRLPYEVKVARAIEAAHGIKENT